MKRSWPTVLVLVLVSSLLLSGASFAQSTAIEVKLPPFKVTLNGTVIDNLHSKYPLLLYKDITYFPMTWNYARALGLVTGWSQSDGFSVWRDTSAGPVPVVQDLGSSNSLTSSYRATIPTFRIRVNGKEIDNQSEPYPLFVFRDITYFPMTWRFAVTEFAFKTNWSSTAGFSIDTAKSTVNHVILSVVYVTPEWMPYDDIGGWDRAVPYKESQGVKFYEAAIWEETKTINLYEFRNDYDMTPRFRDSLPPVERRNYREGYCIKKFAGLPAERAARGQFVLDAFTEIAQILTARQPNASHNLIYLGHGGPGGELFEHHLNHVQAKAFLAAWHSALGRKLGFVDMGHVCMKGSFQDLETFAEHADYYIASDLSTGCFQFDNWTEETFNQSDFVRQYPRLLATNPSMKDALVARVDLMRLQYDASRNYITQNKVMQSLYLYSCSQFGKAKNSIASFVASHDVTGSMRGTVYNDIDGERLFGDTKEVLADNGATPALLDALSTIILHGVDTKDFFGWQEDWGGLMWLMREGE